MGYIGSYGEWVRRRRKHLDLTQAELASKVSCSLSMLRKIERDERRPSVQLAELLADHLAIEAAQRGPFLRLARGKFVQDLGSPTQPGGIAIPDLAKFRDPTEDQAPFVSRERELRTLHEHLDKALEGQGRVVFISGEAGRGKTSLLYEFARRALEVQPDLLVAGGRSDIYTGQGDPLLPFRDISRMLV